MNLKMSKNDKTIKMIINEGFQILNENSIPTPRLDAELLLAFILNKDRSYFFTYPDEKIEDNLYARYMQLIEQRKNHKPFQYVVGNQEFMGLLFHVNSNVLIPRPDTEILVETILDFIKGKNTSPKILDIGTGSGAISISLAYYSSATLWAIDISPDALTIAKENASIHNVSDRITFLHGHLFHPAQGQKFDIIVSNPPYISKIDMDSLPPSVKNYEPSLALYGGIDGLDFYRQIIKKASLYLEADGAIFFEIGYDQGESVSKLIEQEGLYKNIHVIKDLSGLDRVIQASIKRTAFY